MNANDTYSHKITRERLTYNAPDGMHIVVEEWNERYQAWIPIYEYIMN